VSGWDADGTGEIIVGRRRVRAGKRRSTRRIPKRVTLLVLLMIAGLGAGGYYLVTRPTGLEAVAGPTVIAPGGFRASIGTDNTITVGLELRSVADFDITLLDPKVVPPAGLTVIAVTLLGIGEGNEGFALTGALPPNQPLVLGTTEQERNGILAAQLRVDCAKLDPQTGSGEQIFVTVQVGDDRRVEELTSPVIGELPWLVATAATSCADPEPTGTAEPPLPPLPGHTASPSPSPTAP
jgi:hypothetical protein